jgi:hypothetical protein
MIKVKPKIALNLIESFFYEKSLELLHRNTIDTNRLKLSNPLLIIKELTSVCSDLAKNKLKNHDYATSVIKETLKLTKDNHHLKSTVISIDYFNALIEKSNKDDYLKIVHAGNLIVNDNKDYTNTLFEEIYKIIVAKRTDLILDYDDLKKFSRLIEYLYVELCSIGYSKFYLYRFLTAIFSGVDAIDFDARYSIIKSLKDRPVENFEVIFGLDSTKFDKTKVKLLSNGINILNKSDKTRISVITKNKVDIFFDENEEHLLLSLNVNTKDYYQALNLSRSKLLNILDVLYLGHSDKNLSLIKDCFIVGSNQPDKSSSLPTMYQIDGYYKSNNKVYKVLIEKFTKINNSNINDETKNKINSGIRYLRMGGESGELINKYINYWIGLEYIFSTYDADSYTIGRLREYFKRAHALIYIKRNINDFHKDIKILNEHHLIPDYNDDLEYLKVENNYNLIIASSVSPLLRFRAEYFKNLLMDNKKVRAALENHQKNLEWNLTRIYRIRNEIVHNAAIKEDIAVLTSHLRYYLTFIINGLIDFLINNPKDVNNDDQINIDDYFILQDLTLASLEKKGVELIDLIGISNPMEIIT